MKFVFLSLFISFTAFADCLVVDLPVETVEAEKFWVDDKVNNKKPELVTVYLKVGNELYFNDGFYCSRKEKTVNCVGDDDAGSFYLMNNQIHLDRLLVGNPDRYADFKGAKGFFDLKKSECPKINKKK